jgi:hypothetical protein
LKKKRPADERGTLEAYARRRGCAPYAVTAAIQSGRIAEAVGADGLIEFAAADRLWAERTNPALSRGKKAAAGADAPEAYAAARARRESAAADREEIERDRLLGSVILRAEAERIFARFGGEVKAAVRNMMASLAPRLAGKSETEMDAVLRREAEECLSRLADDMSKAEK